MEGLARYNEVTEKYNSGDYLAYAALFEPKSVTYTNTVIRRSVCLTTRHNAQPMYAYGARKASGMRFPKAGSSTFLTHGLEVTRYKPVDFDIKECLLLPTRADYIPGWDPPAGDVSDFHVEMFGVTTNGVETRYGWIEFAPGCGAYKRHITDDPTFPTTYEADTNETYLTRFPFECSIATGRVVHAVNILESDEYMVLRTRVEKDAAGAVTNCNYSKILGPLSAWDRLYLRHVVFNPRPNDPNLEFDTENNLVASDPDNSYP